MPKYVVKPEEVSGGAPMERGAEGYRPVRDLKVIYPETVDPDPKSLILGVVEVDPGHHTPLHRHRCEEVYYILEGEGEIEIEGEKYPVKKGYGVFLPEGVRHRVFNTGDQTLRYVVVGGIMFVPLIPKWPSESPYEILE
ncbi:MAG: cupin domain-containing protein [Candidatus Korarchaeota archaeon]|nr:cupin domain-containing protein [Candidatus Korarchaeota archaeon]